jgi:Helicase associated domain
VDNSKLSWLDDENHQVHSMGTTISAEDMDWNERFESLLNFADEFGHCNVPLQREYPLPSGNLA